MSIRNFQSADLFTLNNFHFPWNIYMPSRWRGATKQSNEVTSNE